ncbi:MerR family DNA-binding transcriptional regulator [Paenibacillus sedimenti]|uniref:MerR family transcriptional regulator n=1 Tax=Paenibacillus sedimenti TaxID=2770274 RepID=A0A926KNP8_9BACL|nr:MerR family transcriptional regulator [Paenibacillus sedimenti]MBD0381212.1 MerR family transcriptional regulator [Paenibacillus sedimenti]
MRPIDIAKKLNISTSALRNYEAQGMVPPTKRSSTGYRIYTEEHIAYFECIIAMSPWFGMELTSEVLRKIQLKDVDSALWMVNEMQANLHRDKTLAEKTIQLFETQELDPLVSNRQKEWMTIGEVSAATAIPSSAIRHWEKVGLITSSRNHENGYRMFNRPQLRKILLIRTLRTTVYSNDSVTLKQAIQKLDHNDVEQARNIAIDSLDYLNKINRSQLRGIYKLYRLCQMLNLFE